MLSLDRTSEKTFSRAFLLIRALLFDGARESFQKSASVVAFLSCPKTFVKRMDVFMTRPCCCCAQGQQRSEQPFKSEVKSGEAITELTVFPAALLSLNSEFSSGWHGD